MTLRRARWENGLLLLAAVGLSIVTVATRDRMTGVEQDARAGHLFPAFQEEDLDAVRLTRSTGKRTQSLRLVRDDQSDDPHDFFLFDGDAKTPSRLADRLAMVDFLRALDLSVWTRRIEDAQLTATEIGLDHPTLELQIDLARYGYRLLIGKEAPAPPGAHYAEVTGPGQQKVVGVINASLVERFEEDLRHFRGRLLLPHAKSELREVRLSGLGGPRVLVQDEAGFRLDSEKGPRADAEAVDRVLFQMARFDVSEFVEVEVAENLFQDAKAVRITQAPRTGETLEALVGAACPKSTSEPSVVAFRKRPDPLAGCVPKTVMTSLETPREQLVDDTPFPVSADEVDHVTIRTDDETPLEIVRSGAQFRMTAPETRDLALDLGNEWLTALLTPRGEFVQNSDANAAPAPDLASLGLAPPAGTVAIRAMAAEGDEPVELKVDYSLPDERGVVHLFRHDDGAVLALDRHKAWAFSRDMNWTRDRSLIEVADDDIRRIEVTQGDLTLLVERNDEGLFRLLEPKGRDVDSGLVSDWTRVLAHLRAARFETERRDIGRERLRVRFSITSDDEAASEKRPHPAAARSVELRVGDRTAGGYLAELASVGATTLPESQRRVFVLPPSDVRTLSTLVLDRGPMLIDTHLMSKIIIATPDRTHALEQRAGAWVSSEGDLPRHAVAGILEQLDALRPLAAVRVGPPRLAEGFETPSLEIRAHFAEPPRDGSARERTWVFGAASTYDDEPVRWARRNGVEVTYAMARDDLRALLDLL